MIYYSGFLLVFSFLWLANSIQKSRYYYYVLIAILCLFCGVRDSSVGVDTNNYVGYFLNIDVSEAIFYNPYSMESGFVFVSKIIRQITDNYLWFLLSTGAIAILLTLKSLQRISSNLWFSIFIFIGSGNYFFIFNGLRQAIAIGFCFYSLAFLYERRFSMFLFIVLFGALFHSTALIFLFLYFVLDKKLDGTLLLKLSFFVLAFVVALNNLGFFLGSDAQRYTDYISRGSTGGEILALVNVFIFCFSLAFRKWIPQEHRSEYERCLILCFITACIYLLVIFLSLDVNFLRLASYFSIGQMLIIPVILRSLEYNVRMFANFIIYLAYFLFYTIYTYKMGLGPYIVNPVLF